MGPILRPVQLRGRDRETGPEPTPRANNVVRPMGQRPGARSAFVGQRQADATAGGRTTARRHATALDQVEAEACVSNLVQSGLDRHRQPPILAGVAAHGRRSLRQQPRIARPHAFEANGQIVAQAAHGAQGDRDRATRTANGRYASATERRRFPKQKTEK